MPSCDPNVDKRVQKMDGRINMRWTSHHSTLWLTVWQVWPEHSPHPPLSFLWWEWNMDSGKLRFIRHACLAHWNLYSILEHLSWHWQCKACKDWELFKCSAIGKSSVFLFVYFSAHFRIYIYLKEPCSCMPLFIPQLINVQNQNSITPSLPSSSTITLSPSVSWVLPSYTTFRCEFKELMCRDFFGHLIPVKVSIV